MKTVRNKKFDEERALYRLENTVLTNVKFLGKKDGESVLKETKNLKIISCKFNLRYPLWHSENVSIEKTDFLENTRAGFWYCKNTKFNNSKLKSVKPFRECSNIVCNKSDINAIEPFWRCEDVLVNESKVKGVYPFFECKNLTLNKIEMEGKYSLQYGNNIEIKNSKFKTKDALWHSKNIIVKDSILDGEYIAWFSENLTLINCKIISHQPFCYCKNLKIINCQMLKCDLSFEYSDVDADISGSIDSIKNVKSGIIKVNKIKEIINTEDSKYKSKVKIIYK